MKQLYDIIHIDDNNAFLDITEMLIDEIEEININYRRANDVEEIPLMIQEKFPDLLISDLMLSSWDDAIPGVQFIKDMKNKYNDLKIIALTSRADKFLKIELENYVEKYITKTNSDNYFKNELIKILKK